MRRGLVCGLLYLAALLFIPEAWAGLRSGISKGDLNVPDDYLDEWWPAAQAESNYNDAQSWSEYDVTCDLADYNDGGCASGKLSWELLTGVSGCSNVTATTIEELDCMVDNATETEIILYVPAGTYEFNSAGDGLTIGRSNIVVRGVPGNPVSGLTTIFEAQFGRFRSTTGGDCDANSGGLFGGLCGPSFLPDHSPSGTWISWTNGYTRGTTTVTLASTTGFDVGQWIVLHHGGTNACEMIDHPTASPYASLHMAKVESIGAGTITMDRPLRYDYNRPGCTGFEAAPFEPITNVGIENIHFTSYSADSSNWEEDFPHYVISGAAEGWFANNRLDRAFQKWWDVGFFTARFWMFQNSLDEMGQRVDGTEGAQLGGGAGRAGAMDVVYENNIFASSCKTGGKIQGVNGAVIAYNYSKLDTGLGSCGAGQRSFNTHGHYNASILFEGNVLEDDLRLGDGSWGRDGKRNTAYRNRMADGPECRGSGNVHNAIGQSGFPDPEPAAEQISIIGNSVGSIISENVGNCNSPISSGSDDMTDWVSDAIWVERNAWRYVFDPGDSDTTVRSCGTALDDTCPGNNHEQNDAGDGPVDITGETMPFSLYRTETPDWWCQEACDFTDVKAGVGAFGDDFFNGTLCKTPAQILDDGDTCTLGGAATPAGDPGGTFGGGIGP